eukprot:SAG25_NODE_519_length_7241_cov_159.775553_5_plen_167_part_00
MVDWPLGRCANIVGRATIFKGGDLRSKFRQIDVNNDGELSFGEFYHECAVDRVFYGLVKNTFVAKNKKVADQKEQEEAKKKRRQEKKEKEKAEAEKAEAETVASPLVTALEGVHLGKYNPALQRAGYMLAADLAEAETEELEGLIRRCAFKKPVRDSRAVPVLAHT